MVLNIEHLLKYDDKYGSGTFFLILFLTLWALLLWARLKELRFFFISVISSYNSKVCSIFLQEKSKLAVQTHLSTNHRKYIFLEEIF